MSRSLKIGAAIVLAVGMALAVAVYALFQGYFDRGKYEIVLVQRFSPDQFAVVAKRCDNDALNGDINFVLIGDHLFSPPELKRAYYARESVFGTDADCLTLRWENATELVVSCVGSSIKPGHIDFQHRRSGQISISYVNIPTN
jgi:hypothetical protein